MIYNESSELETNGRFLNFVRRYAHQKAEGFFDDESPMLVVDLVDECIAQKTGIPAHVVCEARLCFEDGTKALSDLAELAEK